MQRLIGLAAAALLSCAAHAVPVLQVGAPGGPGEGTYADYAANASNPTETDTAFTNGSTIFVAGLFNNNVLKLGGQNAAPIPGDWGDEDIAFSAFNGHEAVLLAAVPDGMGAAASASLRINGVLAFLWSATLNGLFPNNHDPLKDAVSDFLFFDIGKFAQSVLVPDFADESIGSKLGEIKSLTLTGMGSLPWIHFDAVALESKSTSAAIRFSPGSHDLTWQATIPEPGSIALVGLGLLAIGFKRSQRPTLH